MKKLFLPLAILAACTSQPKEKPEVILQVSNIVGKTLPQVEDELGGRAKSTDYHSGYPCNTDGCFKAIFEGGTEIIFKDSVADRITIHHTPDLTSKENPIAYLGIEGEYMHTKKPGNFARYNNVAGLHEVNFSTDFILVQASKPE